MSHLAPHVANVLDHDVTIISYSEHIGHLPPDVEADPVLLVTVSNMDSANNLAIDTSKTDYL